MSFSRLDGFPPLEAMLSYGYGHSALAATGQGRTASSSWAERVVKRLRMGTYTNRALASYEMQNVAINAFGGSVAALTWSTGAKGVVYLDCGLTDMFGSMSSARKETCFTHAVRHFLHQMSAASKINDATTFTRTGSWTQGNSSTWSNGSRLHTTTNGDFVVVPFTGDSVVITVIGLDDASFAPGGSNFSITANVGTSPQLPINGTTSNGGKVSVNIPAQTFVPMAIKISGFGAGSHSVKITHTGTTGEWLLLDDALVPSATPPTILIQKIMYCTSAYYATTSGQVDDSIIDTYNGLFATIAAEFSNVHMIDSQPGFNPATMLHSDGAHKNDLGEYHRAGVAVQKIYSTLDWRNGQNELAVP